MNSVIAEPEEVDFVLRHLRQYPTMNRFDLIAIPGSPLGRATAFYVLRDMEDSGLITSRIQGSHRVYRMAPR